MRNKIEMKRNETKQYETKIETKPKLNETKTKLNDTYKNEIK